MMREPKIFAGDRLRRLREERGLSQVALAKALGISSSYLSQIESDERPLTRRLHARIADSLNVRSGTLHEAEDVRVAADLREASSDPMFGGSVSASEAAAAIRAAPGIARRFLDLYRSYLALEEEHHSVLAAADVGAVASRFPYDEVRDWVQTHRNYFDPLDRAAEQLAESQKFDASNRGDDLVRHLQDHHDIQVDTAHTELGDGIIWRLDRANSRLSITPDVSSESRVFSIAHIIGLLEAGPTIDRLVRQARLGRPDAVALARVGLANYFAGALVMPYGAFLAEARSLRYDIERLQTRFGVSFEQVCHRLSTMQRPNAPGIPFYFLKTDIAGNVLKRSSATRFQFARFGGPCPLWNVHQAFAQPGKILVQLARTPDGVSYLCMARTVMARPGRYLDRPRAVAVGLGCETMFAGDVVYSTGLRLSDPDAAERIGPGCRACERTDCRHRALPPVGHALDVGSAERGLVPYRITT